MKMSDEEIKQWREERRNNWPTAANIKKKEDQKKLELEEGLVF
jgi:hypothetical protein